MGDETMAKYAQDMWAKSRTEIMKKVKSPKFLDGADENNRVFKVCIFTILQFKLKMYFGKTSKLYLLFC